MVEIGQNSTRPSYLRPCPCCLSEKCIYEYTRGFWSVLNPGQVWAKVAILEFCWVWSKIHYVAPVILQHVITVAPLDIHNHKHRIEFKHSRTLTQPFGLKISEIWRDVQVRHILSFHPKFVLRWLAGAKVKKMNRRKEFIFQTFQFSVHCSYEL